MAANYLHGVETIEITSGVRPIRVVKSATIALVGIAPDGEPNKLTLVTNRSQADQFGAEINGFNIPQALRAIFAQGAGTVLVVNTMSETNLATVTNESKVVASDGTFQLAYAPITSTHFGSAVVVTDGASPLTTFVEGTDYTFDEFGKFTIVSGGAIAVGDTVKVTYKRLDPNTVSFGQIEGDYDTGTDVRTGMRCFELAYNTFGFKPRLWIAPGYSSAANYANLLIQYATTYKGHAIIDAPFGTTMAEAIAGRGPLGAINFNTSSKRAILCYPGLKMYGVQNHADDVAPFSQFLAGVIAATDNNEGYWVSPSNHEILGITGVETTISAAINDASTDANLLNENGIVTVFNSFGTGIRVWGNRSAAWPSETAPVNFINVQRTADILHESVELAMLPFIDRPINNAIIDSIKESVNAFIRTLIGRGALVDGECIYDPADNSAEELALGHLVFKLTFMPPTPAERITFNSFIDINLLGNLGA